MGIGVNSGPVMSGHVGSERRLEYAVIGDTTNVAARLEAMTKDSPHHLLVGEGTRALLSGDERGLVKVGRLAVSGRREPLDVCAFATEASGGASAPTGETGAPDVESAALPTPEPA
jgi:class 3 adenylate cyclase